MTEDNDEILDYRSETPPRVGLIKILFAAAILMLVYWFIADDLGWAHKSWGLVSGLVLLIIIIVIRFVLNPRPALFEILYFIGKLVLIAGIFVSFMDFPNPYYYIFTAAALFLIGIIIPENLFKKS